MMPLDPSPGEIDWVGITDKLRLLSRGYENMRILEVSVMEPNESRKGLPEQAVKLIIWCTPTLALLLIGFFLRGWMPDLRSVTSYMLVSIFGIGLVPNHSSIPALLTIPAVGLIFTRMIFALRSRRKAVIKALLIAVWLIILAIVSFFSIFIPRTLHWTLHFQTETNARSRFETRVMNHAIPLETETASSAEYHEVIHEAGIFESCAYVLLCNYGEADYKEALASLEDRCGFRTAPLGTGCFDENHVEMTIEPYAMIGDDRFRVISPEDGSFSDFYKGCLLLMNNDAKRQIGYILFYDPDLDWAEDFSEFINEYCGWKYIQS